jgi:putative transposase
LPPSSTSTTEPDLGMSTDRATDHTGLRYSHQEGCGAAHSRGSVPPESRRGGPSWLTVLGHAKDSLWSLDLFRCESAILHTHGVLVVMDQCTRRIVGFGVHRGVVDGVALCQMFNRAMGHQLAPTYLSSDHDPLYRFHQWQANLRILDVTAIKTVPYVPLSHPFVERLIGTIRRECLDRMLFWTAADLDVKLRDFQRYSTIIARTRGWAG